MLGQPVAEERVRHPHADGACLVGHERGGLEPRVKAVAVDFRLDPGEDLIPDIPGHFRPRRTAVTTFAPSSPSVRPLSAERLQKTSTKSGPFEPSPRANQRDY